MVKEHLIKSQQEIKNIAYAADVTSKLLQYLKSKASTKISPLDLDKLAFNFIKKNNCQPNFLGYYSYPNSICVSINNCLIHGIPTNDKFKNFDLISIDAGCSYQGYHADSAISFLLNENQENINLLTNDDIKLKQLLINVAKNALNLAINNCKPNVYLGTISWLINQYVKSFSFHVIKEYGGHGIGNFLHEKPIILNYGQINTNLKLKPNMVICIEPMILTTSSDIIVGKDNWSVYSKDQLPTAHYEATILITKNGAKVLTKIS